MKDPKDLNDAIDKKNFDSLKSSKDDELEIPEDIKKVDRMDEIQKEIDQLPKGNITYKTINGKKQPYLQWTEDGVGHTVYVKVNEREHLMLEIEKRRTLERERELLEIYSTKVSEILSRNPYLKGHTTLGEQDFSEFRKKDDIIYVDKTNFITKWWKTGDKISLVTRPRRFGKTLMLSKVEHFFSNRIKDGARLFHKLRVMRNPEMVELMGTYPVICFSFSGVKDGDFDSAQRGMCYQLKAPFHFYEEELKKSEISEADYEKFKELKDRLDQSDASVLIHAVADFCEILYRTYGKKVIILMDEYDTPMQEAYQSDQWEEMTAFMRRFFHYSFKTNPFMERALLTGITRVSKESMFSDMNQVAVYTVTSELFAEDFGFTEKEVRDLLICNDVHELEEVKNWYDGFRFGNVSHIYNPWSICCYVSTRKLEPYWVDTGGYGLVNKILQNGKLELFDELKLLLEGKSLVKKIDENITFRDILYKNEYFWPLLLSAGGVTTKRTWSQDGENYAELCITNKETQIMYRRIVNNWFGGQTKEDFCRCLLEDNFEYINIYMNEIALESFSAFDVGGRAGRNAPERFYHGFVLGLLMELRREYVIDSNRESGLGRYDIMIKPKDTSKLQQKDSIIIEFKVFDEKHEKSLDETADRALTQIADKKYEVRLIAEGIPAERIRKYGFAFDGKEVLVKKG